MSHHPQAAAPEMLEALEEFVSNIDAINLVLGRDTNPVGAKILERARAKGEKP